MNSMGPELTIRGRIKFILSQKNVSIAEFAGGNDTLRIKLTRQLNGTNEVGLNLVELFLQKFPDISAEWLLRGIGGIYVQDHLEPKFYNHQGDNCAFNTNGTQTVTSQSDAALQAKIDGLIKQLELKDDIIAYRDKTIEELRSDKRFLNNQLSALLIKIKKQA